MSECRSFVCLLRAPVGLAFHWLDTPKTTGRLPAGLPPPGAFRELQRVHPERATLRHRVCSPDESSAVSESEGRADIQTASRAVLDPRFWAELSHERGSSARSPEVRKGHARGLGGAGERSLHTCLEELHRSHPAAGLFHFCRHFFARPALRRGSASRLRDLPEHARLRRRVLEMSVYPESTDFCLSLPRTRAPSRRTRP